MPLHRLLVYHSCVVFDCCMRAPLCPVWLYSYITLLSLLSGNYRPVESALTLKLFMCCQVEIEVRICPLQASSNVLCLCTCVWWGTLHYLVRQEHIFTCSHYEHSTATHALACTHVGVTRRQLMFCLGWFLLSTLQICLMQYQRQCA